MPGFLLVVLFALWLGTGFLIWNRSAKLKAKILGWPRGKRLAFALACLFGGALVLLSGFYAIGLIDKPSPVTLFVLFGLLGCIFVGMQTLAGVSLVTLLEETVTHDTGTTSISQDRKETP